MTDAESEKRHAETRGLVRDLTTVLEKRNQRIVLLERQVKEAEARYEKCHAMHGVEYQHVQRFMKRAEAAERLHDAHCQNRIAGYRCSPAPAESADDPCTITACEDEHKYGKVHRKPSASGRTER